MLYNNLLNRIINCNKFKIFHYIIYYIHKFYISLYLKLIYETY